MNKIILVSLLVLALALAAFTPALAEDVLAQGLCPVGFSLHHVREHADHGHQHIGTAADQNGDTYICAKHTRSDKHVHIDNSIPVK
ncbi:MAG TPA: hypothetical protein VJ436_03740 [Anaerolineales bacterium]|nr:hypothetical protein [Anaerolineales bacterium]